MKKTIVMLVMAFAIQGMFAQNQLEGFTKSDKGVLYKFEKRNETGTQVKEGDIIVGQASISLGDSMTMNGFSMPPQPIFMVTMRQNVFKGDLMEGLLLMKTGEICTFAFPHDSIAKAMQLPPFFKQEDYAYFRVSINSLTTEEVLKREDSIRAIEQTRIADSLKGLEQSKIDEYLLTSDLPKTPTSGVYFKMIQEGTGIKPEANYKVHVNYTGRFLNGKLFDTSLEEVANAEGKHQPGRNYEPLQFTIGQHMMIEGFERAVKMMHDGGKAVVLIPSELAYGGQQRGEIMPYSPLLFELEIVKVEKGEAPAPSLNAQPIKVQQGNTKTSTVTPKTTPANTKKPSTKTKK
ncbi:MAG: FKBP-type peptidyl-prolyl cis-trans isomerase [Bacteroidales bacterium]|nr:FKBP-type peptidyl-prolyl cis-trans isomerase [Bacteroidales bacterium]